MLSLSEGTNPPSQAEEEENQPLITHFLPDFIPKHASFSAKHAGKSSKYAGFCFISYQFLPQNPRKSVLILGRIAFQSRLLHSFFFFPHLECQQKKGDLVHFVRG